MGNGDEIRASGVCKDLCLQLAEINVVVDSFPLKLGASDVVLGFQWQATLGDSLMNWGNLCLQVTLEGSKVQIQGNPTLSKSQVSLHSLICSLKRERQGVLLELQSSIPRAQLEPDLVPTYPLSLTVIRLL